MGGWGEFSPLVENLLIPPHHQEIFPPPIRLPPPPTNTKFLSPPYLTRGSFPNLPLNNSFLNCQNHSSLDSHHPIKKSPAAKFIIPLDCGKRIFPLPLKTIRKTLHTPSFQSLNQSFISNQGTISI